MKKISDMSKKEYQKQYYQNHKEKSKDCYAKYYQNHKEHRSKYNKEYYQNHFQQLNDKERRHAYYVNNRERIKEKAKIRRNNNKDYYIKYYQNHKEEIKVWQNNHKEERKTRENNRWRTDLKYKLNKAIRDQTNFSLKGNKEGKHWEDLVGYTVSDLMGHLKSTMPEGYTWEDYLNGGLHIDHKIPISVFNFSKPEHIDFKRCWYLSNLRLLPAKENIKKGNHLTKPFQPALKI